MSSGITENYVNEGKLVVRIAENGQTFELNCDGTTQVEVVMRWIESASGINFNDQVVLCLDMKLESQRPLSAYKLPANDREVFIFNKARLQINSPAPPVQQIDVVEVADPTPPALLQNPHPLDSASDPALKALPSYEREFRYHYQRSQAIYSRTVAKYEICDGLLKELKVQERALEVARSNVDQFYRLLYQNYLDFIKRYKHQHRVHSDLLVNFGRDIEKLRFIKLHPALQTDTRSCLLDFVKEESIQKSAEICTSSHRQFENKVLQFQQMFNDVKRRVEEFFPIRASVTIRNLEQNVKEHQRYISEQRSIMQSLSKDVNTVKKLVDDCLSCQLSSSLRPHDAVSALGPMYDVHDKNHLPRMQTCDHLISKLLDICKDKKNEMNIFVHNYMQKITHVTSVIKDVKFQFPVFKEAMARQEEQFTDLKVIHGIGHAYRACLAEIVRRKASMKIYMGKAGQLAERLATEREAEVRKREEFLKAQSAYIPRDIFASMGLYTTPSQCDVNIVPFDTNLLDIDISDVEYYAPEYLAGSPVKLLTSKSSVSMSNHSSHSVETEEISVETLEKEDSEDFLEGSELVDIAGTSKMEVENARLKAELAEKIAYICFLHPQAEHQPLDDNKLDDLFKNAKEKTDKALHEKDEYIKHLHSIIKAKQIRCASYETRIQELEQRLSDQYLQGQKFPNTKDVSDFTLLAAKSDGCKQEVSCGREVNVPYISTTEPMDEVSCISNSLDAKLGPFTRLSGKGREGVDENMMDSSGVLNPQLDSSMLEQHRDELQVNEKGAKDKMVGQLGMSLTNSSTAESMPVPQNLLPCDLATGLGLESKDSAERVLELQSALVDKSNQLSDTETRLKDAMEEVAVLRRELEMSQKLLDESQMNCAHLENCLHEAREEAQTHLCAADRRASEYSALRASAVKMRGLFERLRSCVYAPGGVIGFADALRALAQSLLSNSIADNEDDGTAEFRKCIRILADKVSFLSRHRDELIEKYPKIEAANEQLRNELEEKKDLVKTLYTKHQLEKQANKEKISFGRLEVHEIGAFVLKSKGHYEAITRNCSNYYLSAESVALFTDHLPNPPSYIVGQIVHIERQTVKPLPSTSMRADLSRADQMDNVTSDKVPDRLTLNSGSVSNPYGLPIGCEYFVVTVAMLPDAAIHSPPAS